MGQNARALIQSHTSIAAFASAAAPAQSSAIIKQLREKSGAPIADVKAMLVANSWDMDKAYDALRKKGLAAAAKKASRHAAEGLVGCSVVGNTAVVAELNSETDFVARNAMFQQLLGNVLRSVQAMGPQAGAAAGGGAPGTSSQELDMEKVSAAPSTSGAGSVTDAVTHVAATMRENVRLRRVFRVATGPEGLVSSYVHAAVAPGLGKLAAVVVLETEGAAPAADQLPALRAAGEQLAMHVAGMRPSYLSRDAVPGEVLERERRLLAAQLAADPSNSSKPPAVLAKVVEGRLGKLLGEWCLLEQRFVMDDGLTVDAMLKRLSKDVGRRVRVASFLRVQCGEGLDAKTGGDFAAEVAKIIDESA